MRTEPSAQELILEVYRQRQLLADSGGRATRVIMSLHHYRTIQQYHALLGGLPEGRTDYIDRYRLFDLEICVEQVECPRVE